LIVRKAAGLFCRITGGATYIGDNSKARREPGYAPRTLAEGWPATILHEMKLLGITK
jgi:hypothetical protein